MSVNPCFDVAILLARCKSDIEQFIKIIKEKNPPSEIQKYYEKIQALKLLIIEPNAQTNQSLFDQILEKKETAIQMMYTLITSNSNNSPTKTYMNNFDYLHSVSEIMKTDIEKARQCWVLRTILFYLLLISATLIMQDKILFDNIFPESKLTFKFNIRSELKNFHLGIFGSLNPTSDIDVGIRYVGNIHDLCALDYVVCVVEDLFPSFLGVESSLKLDIEPYADMYILPNLDEKTKSEFPDIFFLNTSNFTSGDFLEVLPYVYASIIRNYIKGLHIDVKIQENKATILKGIENLKTDNLAFLTVIDYDVLITKLPSQYTPGIITTITEDVDKKKITEELILEFLNLHKVKIMDYIGTNINTVAFEKGLEITLKYMQNDYNVSRQEYYTLVKKAETSLIPVKQHIYGSSPIKQDAIKECMKNIMHSLVYREESYVCPATITHIVRTIQDTKFKTKYPTNNCGIMNLNTTEITKINNPYCSIGNYGFLISAMEQYGYLFRFYNSYCNIEEKVKDENKNEDNSTDNNRSEDDGKHCISKNEKYIYRFYDAIYNIEKEPKKEGGKRKSRKIRKRTRKNRKSNRKRIIHK